MLAKSIELGISDAWFRKFMIPIPIAIPGNLKSNSDSDSVVLIAQSESSITARNGHINLQTFGLVCTQFKDILHKIEISNFQAKK